MRIDSWLFWALKGFAAEKKCSLDDAVESILYDRIQEEIENSDEFQHGGE